MKKFVQNNARTATVTLDGGECEVIFDSRYNVFSVQSESEVTVALESGKSAEDDGVMVCKGGESVMYPHMMRLDRLYITGTGKVNVFASNEAVNPFKKMGKGGDGNEQDIRIPAFGLQISGFDVNVLSTSEDCKKAVREKTYYLNYSGTVFAYNGRTVSRSTDLPAYCAYLWLDSWFTPCVISEYEEAVAYRIYVENSLCQGSVEYMGKTWYYNMYSGGSYPSVHDSSEYKRYFLGSYTSAGEAETKPVYDLLDFLKSLGEV